MTGPRLSKMAQKRRFKIADLHHYRISLHHWLDLLRSIVGLDAALSAVGRS
jgi:hypothetical protein